MHVRHHRCSSASGNRQERESDGDREARRGRICCQHEVEILKWTRKRLYSRIELGARANSPRKSVTFRISMSNARTTKSSTFTSNFVWMGSRSTGNIMGNRESVYTSAGVN